MRPDLSRLLAHAKQDPDVVAIIRFGSTAKEGVGRDVDLAVVLRVEATGKASTKDVAYKAFSSDRPHEGLDVSVFQALPLYVRHRVLAEGETIWTADEDALYEVAFQTVRAWEDFKPHYRAYLDAVAHG